MSVSHPITRPNHRHVMALPLAQRHFIDPYRFQRGERSPIHGRGYIMVHDPFHRLDAHLHRSANISYGAVDQVLQQPLLERFGVRTVRVIPGTRLGRGWSSLTNGTAVALRADLDPDRAAKDR